MKLTELSLESFIYSISKDKPWMSKVTVEIENRNESKILVVKYHDGFERPRYLRYSRGPAQGFGWDIYGDDMQTEGWALLAISQAPDPRPRPNLEHRS